MADQENPPLTMVDDAQKACEAITSTLLDDLALELDRPEGVVGNWSKFALKLGIEEVDYQQFGIRGLEDPTCRLFEHLESSQPNLTLEKLVKDLRSIKRNKLANLLQNREGNELVKDVVTPESDLLQKISNGLNRKVVGTGDWRNLAYKLNVPLKDYKEFESPAGQEKPSPTIEVLRWVVGNRPDTAISDVVAILETIKQMDVVEEIKSVVGGHERNLIDEISNLRVNIVDDGSRQDHDQEDAAAALVEPAPAQAAVAPPPPPPPPPATAPTAAPVEPAPAQAAVAAVAPPPPAPEQAAVAAAAPAEPTEAAEVSSADDNPQVFLSYQWDLQPTVDNLKKRLEENGISCWMDKNEMGAGDSLRAEIDTGIRNCKVFISCVNKKYCEKSKFCPLEATLAHDLGKFIIPLLLEDIGTWPPKGNLGLVFTDLIYTKVTEASGEIPEETFADLLKQVKKNIHS